MYWEEEENLNDFVDDSLMPSIRDNKIPEPKVGIFQINEIGAFDVLTNIEFNQLTYWLFYVAIPPTNSLSIAIDDDSKWKVGKIMNTLLPTMMIYQQKQNEFVAVKNLKAVYYKYMIQGIYYNLNT